MTLRRLIQRSATYFWRTNLAVEIGVGTAVAVLAGALLVGESVRASLRDIALGRLGNTHTVVASAGFFRDGLAEDVSRALDTAAAPLVVGRGFVTHEPSGRRAANVLVYGVDARFWAFHGLEREDGVQISPALAAELGAGPGDVLLTRLQRPSEIPIESLFGQKEDIGRTLRLTLSSVRPRDALGEFALQPQQGEVRAVFAPLARVQRDLGVPGQVNTVIAGPADGEREISTAFRLEDLGVAITAAADPPGIAVEGASGIVNEPLERAARHAAASIGARPLPVFTYLANTIRSGDRAIPYSLITATELDVLGLEHPLAVDGSTIVLNDWAARELGASTGDRVEIEYYLWDPAAGLVTRSAAFTLRAVIPIAGFAADRRLAPEYPGITTADSLADWDPPFPIDLSRVRPADEAYWDRYRTTPKAFIEYGRGRELWMTRYGGATSVRLLTAKGQDPSTLTADVERVLRAELRPEAMGVTAYPARRLALQASTGATDFGEYFTYFSFFIVVSALLLAVLFFRLGIEQRLRQIGVLRAAGYPMAVVRRMLLAEAVVLSAVGGALGALAAVAYAWVIIHALTTWWVGAVGTTLLRLHVSPGPLVLGAAGGVLAAVLCVIWSLRAVAQLTPRALLSAQAIDPGGVDAGRARRARGIAGALAALGGALLVAAFALPDAQAGAFFGAGAALLLACLFFLASWLRSRDTHPVAGRGTWAVSRLGFRSAAFRPGRSVMSAALIAAAAFIIVSVDAFRRDGGEIGGDPASGTGGYTLLARTELPVLHDPNDPAGREALLLLAPEVERLRFTRFRVRPGEDASCLNLYRPTNPTIIAPEPAFIDAGRFSFSASLAETEEERANPWLLLRRPSDDGTVPAIADATSLQYVLHARVGDTFAIDTGAPEPLVLRFVAALRDSILQGELVIAEEQFTRLFPVQQGYQFFLVDDQSARTPEDAAGIAQILEQELETFGFDAVSTAERLAAFHQVENTYLSTFQALGGLGLLLGTIGLAAVMFRNVLERRRELALLRAVGYDARRVSQMMLAEAGLLLGAGLATGAACAALAIAPAWVDRAGALPGAGLWGLLLAVIVAGLVSSWVATRAALSGRMLDALRAE